MYNALNLQGSFLDTLEKMTGISIMPPDLEICDFFGAYQIYLEQMKAFLGKELKGAAELRSYELSEDLCDYDPLNHMVIISDRWSGEKKPMLESLIYALQTQEISRVERLSDLYSHYFGMHDGLDKTIARELVFNGVRTYITNVMLGYIPEPEKHLLEQYGPKIEDIVDKDLSLLLGSNLIESIGLDLVSSVVGMGYPWKEIMVYVPDSVVELTIFSAKSESTLVH